MTVDTQNLIERLSGEGASVRPVRTSWQIMLIALTCLSATILGVIYWYWKKDEFHIPEGRSSVELLILALGAAVSLVWAAWSASPHHVEKARSTLRTWLSIAIWAGLLSVAFFLNYLDNSAEALVALQYRTWLCPILIVSVALPLSLLLYVQLQRAAILYPWTTSLYLSQLALICGAMSLGFICPWADPLHEMIYHVLPVILFTLVGTALYSGLHAVRESFHKNEKLQS